MIQKLNQAVLGLLVGAFAFTAHAQTNLLQAVNVGFVVYSQGTPVVSAAGTNNIINKASFTTKDLIRILSPSGTFRNGDILARATPVTNEIVNTTNLVAVGATNLVLTNISTSTEIISNVVLYGGTSNYIGGSNVVFGTKIESYGGTNVTIGTNVATVTMDGDSGATFEIGTNTTVTATTLTNAVGENTGTNYAFVINALNSVPTGTNELGAASWVIYNPKQNPVLTPISTNVDFNLHVDRAYHGGTNLAYTHGETITRQNVIKFGTTDEIRSITVSNSTWQIRLTGYAHGRFVPISLSRTDTVSSRDYVWAGSGSGIMNSNVVVVEGAISEDYFKFLK